MIHTPIGDELLQGCASLILESKEYMEVEPALSLKDVWRKQVTEPTFRGKACEERYRRAIRAEQNQRKWLRYIVETCRNCL